jgi:hypothetical protein
MLIILMALCDVKEEEYVTETSHVEQYYTIRFQSVEYVVKTKQEEQLYAVERQET